MNLGYINRPATLSMYTFLATGYWFTISEVPRLKFEIGPNPKRASRDPRRKAGHSKLIRGRVNKQGSL